MQDGAVEQPRGGASSAVPDAPPIQVGDIVYGKVIFSNVKGARVQLTYHDGLIGYVPCDQNPTTQPWPAPPEVRVHRNVDGKDSQISSGKRSRNRQRSPYAGGGVDAAGGLQRGKRGSSLEVKHSSLSSALPQTTQTSGIGDSERAQQQDSWKMSRRDSCMVLPMGHCRSFKVLAVPHDMQRGGKGPLLSAKDADMDVLMYRLQQVMELTSDINSNTALKAVVTGAHAGGLTLTLLGCYSRAFMPWGQVAQQAPGGQGWDAMNGQQLVGCELGVAILLVDGQQRKVVVSEKAVSARRREHILQLGAVVNGVVKNVMPYGAFVRLDVLQRVALLRTDRMTQARRPRSAEDVFEAGDRVTGLLSHIGEDGKLQISVMELEQNPGDMLLGPEAQARCFQAVQQFVAN